ncbi:MAG: ATPase, T2SS/T4P/T4SS family [Candidatus Altiarchaeota archaeon]|nr:ATPase, T2SS/T4P/T4SS family [Candidatus Altiarchaeota archaeon]
MTSNEKVLEVYDVLTGDTKTPIAVVFEHNLKLYKIVVPQVDIATSALLDDIKDKLISGVEMDGEELQSEDAIDNLKRTFKENANRILMEELPSLDKAVKDHFVLSLLNELLGLDEIEFFLQDPYLEEIVINSASEPVRVYHKKYGWLLTNITIKTEAKILNYASTIARRIGREITTLNPLLDAHLISKDRANAILSPIASKGNTITIRKFARDPWTAPDFIMNKTISSEILALMWLAIQYEMNMIVSGGTASGKTSLLNILMPFIQPNHRILSIEDTRELQLPSFLYWCPLVTREPNPEGKGEVSMLDLLVNSLRMRPDRIIMGEVRKQREAEVLFEAMHTGHSVYCTLHADTCHQTITRLTNPPVNIPHSMLDSVHLNVVMFRDRRRGIRRIFELGEFIMDEESARSGQIKYRPNIIYSWRARDDSYPMINQPIRLYDELERHTGMNRDELQKEVEIKKTILDWLVENKLRQVEEVGKIMNYYYMDKETVIDAAIQNKPPNTLLEV